jgi:hypothetical protein
MKNLEKRTLSISKVGYFARVQVPRRSKRVAVATTAYIRNHQRCFLSLATLRKILGDATTVAGRKRITL